MDPLLSLMAFFYFRLRRALHWQTRQDSKTHPSLHSPWTETQIRMLGHEARGKTRTRDVSGGYSRLTWTLLPQRRVDLAREVMT